MTERYFCKNCGFIWEVIHVSGSSIDMSVSHPCPSCGEWDLKIKNEEKVNRFDLMDLE